MRRVNKGLTTRLRTKAITIKGESLARALSAALVTESCWFMTEPLSEEAWEITVKAEALPHVLRALGRIRRATPDTERILL